jgi:hypothetical protein
LRLTIRKHKENKQKLKKMKTNNLLKIAGVFLTGIILTMNVQAAADKNSRLARTSINQLTHSVRLTSEDIRNMQLLLSQSDAVHISWNRNELTFALREGDIPEYTIRFEALNSEPVEDWMFESDYLGEESIAPIEGWMTEADYLESEELPIEGWMLSETRLAVEEAAIPVESWMLDSYYLSR